MSSLSVNSSAYTYICLSYCTRIERAITAVREGEFVVVVDSEDRENEGDLIIAAEKVTAEKIAFMVNETSGLICVGMQGKVCLIIT